MTTWRRLQNIAWIRPPGGHHPQGSVLMKARQNRGKGRHSVLKSVQLADEDEDEDKIGLNEDANDLVVIPKDDDVTGDEAPPVLSASTSSKRKIGGSDNDDDIDDKDATLARKARKTATTARVKFYVWSGQYVRADCKAGFAGVHHQRERGAV
jgi:hypothetical protein